MSKDTQHKEDYLNYLDISDDDILEAMKEIEGYLDITPGDFKEVYYLACRHAIERIMHFVKAKDIMTKTVVSVKKGTSLKEIAEKMASHGISGLPVIEDEDEVIGIISEKDFLFRMVSKETKSFIGIVAQCIKTEGCIAEPLLGLKAEDIMTSPPITVGEDTSISIITNIFTEKSINRVPVIGKEGKLTGIVSRADILNSSFPNIKE